MLPHGQVIRALIPLFFASGTTSLVYETLWARQLHLVFGTSQLAICTVLAAFMAGLALGGLSAARWAERVRQPLLVYAALEAVIGIYAIGFPFLLKLVTPLHLAFWQAVEPQPVVFGAFQFVLLTIALLPPTLCMGATLPLLARFISAHTDEMGYHIGRLYGVNTLGAVLGTALAGFVLLPRLGLSLTTWWAAGANGLLAVAAVWLALSSQPVEPISIQAQGSADKGHPHSYALFAVAWLSGFSSLACEVAWFRLLTLVLGGSAYAFSVMLLAFLLGIGLGGWAGGWAADRSFRCGGKAQVLRHLAVIQIGIAVLAWAAMYAYGELPFSFVWLYTQVEQIEMTPSLLWPATVLLALAVMLPATLLMGATFPYLVRAATGTSSSLSRLVGHLYGSNTCGAIAGVVSGGLFLLPTVHIRGTVLVALSCNLVAAGVASWAVFWATLPATGWTRPIRGLGWGLGIASVIFLIHQYKPPWNPLLMTSGMYQYVAAMDDRSREGLLDFSVRPFELVSYDEGLSSIVTVARNRSDGNLWLANNGKIDASMPGDMATQVLLAHIPLLFRPQAERVLVIGLASGITAGCVTLHPVLSQIDIVELEPAVVTASHEFDAYNHQPLDDARVRLFINDARNYLLLTADHTYDLVISEPSNPWLSGVSNLFTREFFLLGKQKLKPNGIWGQWIQTYGMSPAEVRSLLATFADIYTYVRLFRIDEADVVLIGSDAPLPLQASRIRGTLFANNAVAAELKALDYNRAEDLLSLYQFSRGPLMQIAGAVERNTDDNMRIEYAAPLHLHRDTNDANSELLQSVAELPWEAVEGREQLVALAEAYAAYDWSWRRTLATIQHAATLYPNDSRIPELFRVYERQARLAEHIEALSDVTGR